MAADCLVCSAEVDDELVCTLCSDQLHFLCGYGAELNNNTWRTYFKKGKYVCPVCIVGRSNDLVLKSVSTNQRHIKVSNTITTDTAPTDTEEPAAVEAVVEEVTDDDQAEDGEGSVVSDVADLDDTTVSEYDLYGSSSLCLGGENFYRAMRGTPPHPQTSPVRRSASRGSAGSPPPVLPFLPPHSPPPSGYKVGDVWFEKKPHTSDQSRAKRLVFILKALKNLPSHVSTVVLGDSNTHHVKAHEVDPNGNSVAVRSFSGLCVVSAVLALREYKNLPYQKFRKIVWSLGTNDALHGREQHTAADYPKYVRELYTETKRIFPKASVHFITPFIGVKEVTPAYRKDFAQTLKINCPKITIHHPPSIQGMLAPDGVHISESGRSIYTNFLMKRFTNSKPTTSVKEAPQRARSGDSSSSGPTGSAKANSSETDQYTSPGFAFLPPPFSGHMLPNSYSYPQYQQLRDPTVSGLANGLLYELMTRYAQSTPEPQFRYNSVPPPWPPLKTKQ